MIQGRQREAGLGPLLKVSLNQARKKAAAYLELLGQGLDPIEHKNAQVQLLKPRKTFGDCATELIKSKKIPVALKLFFGPVVAENHSARSHY